VQSEREDLQETIQADVRKEMATPRMAKSARDAMSQQTRRSNQPTRANIQTSPEISFDFSGVVTLDKSFAKRGIIFSQGDAAVTLMYIQTGRVKLSVISKTDKEFVCRHSGVGRLFW
jgi:CRP-like cAMP-binding protein